MGMGSGNNLGMRNLQDGFRKPLQQPEWGKPGFGGKTTVLCQLPRSEGAGWEMGRINFVGSA